MYYQDIADISVVACKYEVADGHDPLIRCKSASELEGHDRRLKGGKGVPLRT